MVLPVSANTGGMYFSAQFEKQSETPVIFDESPLKTAMVAESVNYRQSRFYFVGNIDQYNAAKNFKLTDKNLVKDLKERPGWQSKSAN